MSAPVPLRRRGSWLIGPEGSWQMASVHGPISEGLEEKNRQYFRVETAAKEILLVSRAAGEKGMRELRLDSFLSPRTA